MSELAVVSERQSFSGGRVYECEKTNTFTGCPAASAGSAAPRYPAGRPWTTREKTSGFNKGKKIGHLPPRFQRKYMMEQPRVVTPVAAAAAAAAAVVVVAPPAEDDDPSGLFEGGSAKKAKNRRLHRGMTLPLQTFLKLDNEMDGVVAGKEETDKLRKQSELATTARTLGHAASSLLAQSPHRTTYVIASLPAGHATVRLSCRAGGSTKPGTTTMTTSAPSLAYARAITCPSATRPYHACRAVRQVTPVKPLNGNRLDHGDAAVAAARSKLIDLRHFVLPPDSDVEFARLTPDPDSLYDNDNNSTGGDVSCGSGAFFVDVQREWFDDGRALLVPTDALATLVQAQIALVRRDGDEIYGYDPAPRLPHSSQASQSMPSEDQTMGDERAVTPTDERGTPAHFWLPSGIELDSDSDSDIDNSEVSAILAGDKRGVATHSVTTRTVTTGSTVVAPRPTFTDQHPPRTCRVVVDEGRGSNLVGRDTFAITAPASSRVVQVSILLSTSIPLCFRRIIPTECYF